MLFNGDDGFVVETLDVIGSVVFVLLDVTVMVVFLGCIVDVIGSVVFVLLDVTVMVVFLGCIVGFGVIF